MGEESASVLMASSQSLNGGLLSLILSGTSRIDITPAVPISMGGYGQRAGKLSRSVNDRLFAKALYLSCGSARVAHDCDGLDLYSKRSGSMR